MKSTWILVADNTHARIFTADTPSSALDEIEDFSHTEGRLHDKEITTDLPGRIKSADGSGHAFEQATDPKKHEADNFAHRIAQHLEAATMLINLNNYLLLQNPLFWGDCVDTYQNTLKNTSALNLIKISPPKVLQIYANTFPTICRICDI